jgi:hypothetical protein
MLGIAYIFKLEIPSISSQPKKGVKEYLHRMPQMLSAVCKFILNEEFYSCVGVVDKRSRRFFRRFH